MLYKRALDRFVLYLLLAITCDATVSHLEHGQCHLDSSLAHLASKNFTVQELLLARVKPRQCPNRPPTLLHPKAGNLRLAYVTPWNKDGYAYTTLHTEKLSHVAPVWYQVQLTGSAITLEGAHNVEQAWLSSLSRRTRVVPRFEVRFASRAEVEAILFFPRKEVETIVRRIVDEVKLRGYDGATLEVPYAIQMTALVKQLGGALHALDKELVLVIPAQHDLDGPSPFDRRAMLEVEAAVDLFSLNAYDHASSTHTDTGNAPIAWTRSVLDDLLRPPDSGISLDGDDDADDPFGEGPESDTNSRTDRTDDRLARKLLLGVNFYGVTYTSDGVINTVTAGEYCSLLEFGVMMGLRVEWAPELGEHRMDATLWRIWYPSLLSLLTRVEGLGREYGLGGVAVWEAGQGLDWFWDVL